MSEPPSAEVREAGERIAKKLSSLSGEDATVDSIVLILDDIYVPNIDAIVAEMQRHILEKTIEIVETTTRLPPAYACSKAPTRE
jgi:hypothetical protein